MNNKECNIIRDLLPNYVEKLTLDDTNTYIENHLKECDDCSIILKNIQEDYNEEKEDGKHFIDFAKKYNRKFRHMKFIIISIMLFIIITFTVSTIRKYIILSNSVEQLFKAREANNYHLRMDMYTKDDITTQEIYRKDNKYLYISYFYDKKNLKLIYPRNPIVYYDGQKTYWYSYNEITDSKVYFTENTNYFTDMLMPVKPEFSEILLSSIFSRIDTEIINGKECYRITPIKLIDPEKTYIGDSTIYIDKDTGISVRTTGASVSDNYTVTFEQTIEFDNVIDEDLVVPNEEEYILDEEASKLN